MGTKRTEEQEIDNIIDGFVGDFRLGQKYYVFTVTYHYIGTVSYVGNGVVRLSKDDVIIVSNAGSATDAVSRILAGKSKPEVSEQPQRDINVMIHAITAYIPF